MPRKKKQPAQDVQQITMDGFTQPVPELLGKIAALHEYSKANREQLEQDEAAPEELYAALAYHVESVLKLAQMDSRPRSITIAAVKGSRVSRKCCHYTGSKVYADLCNLLEQLCNSLNGDLSMEGYSVCITGGKDYILPDELEAYRAADPAGAAAWEAEQPKPSEIISNGIARTAFEIDLLKDPEDALLTYSGVPAGYYQRYMIAHHANLVRQVAAATGADPAQLADKRKRTPEQQRALAEAAAQEQLARLDAFMNSNYVAAIHRLEEVQPQYKEQNPAADTIDIKELAVLYFFAKHREIKSTEAAGLTAENLTEIDGIFSRLDSFFVEKAKGGAESTLQWLIEFAEKETQETHEPAAKQAETRIKAVTPTKAGYPLDKVNRNIWELMEEAGEDGQISMLPFAVEKRGSNKEATVYFSIDFDDDTKAIYKKPHLDPFDKRAYLAVYAMQEAQGDYMSLEQIWKTMGNTTRPNARQLQRLNDSLTKMRASIYIDNKDELPVNKKAVHFRYDGPLLPFERTTAYINGKLCGSVIHLFREPPMISFAKSRKQITTIPTKVLASPANKTDDSLRLEDYLLDCIAQIKSGKRSNKILYATLFKHCGADSAKDKMKRSRIKNELLPRLLDFYKETKWIKGYSSAADGVTIQY